MTNITHPELVKALLKPGADILTDLTSLSVDLWHNATGVSGEVGELLEAVLDHALHGMMVDRTNLIEEFGDIEFYMEGVRQNLDIGRSGGGLGASNDGYLPMRDIGHLAVAASKLLDAAKKRAIYAKDDVRSLIEDALCEMELHMEKLRYFFQINREETLAANIAKLSVRYESLTYSNEAAQTRADKL